MEMGTSEAQQVIRRMKAMENKRIALSSETRMLKKYWKVVTSYDDVVNIVMHASACNYYWENKN
jgi:hypothetical protein